MKMILPGNAGALDGVAFQGGSERRRLQDSITHVKRFLTVLLGLGLMGCASQQPVVNLENPDSAIIGEKPEGYPRTIIKHLPDLPGFCIEVTEDWREHPYQGETIWLKEKTIKSLNCPRDALPGKPY